MIRDVNAQVLRSQGDHTPSAVAGAPNAITASWRAPFRDVAQAGWPAQCFELHLSPGGTVRPFRPLSFFGIPLFFHEEKGASIEAFRWCERHLLILSLNHKSH